MITNLCKTMLGMSQKFRRINSVKLDHAFSSFTCLRVSFFAERLKHDIYVTNFFGWLPLHQCYSSIWVVLSSRANIVQLIPIKTTSLMFVKKVKGTSRS